MKYTGNVYELEPDIHAPFTALVMSAFLKAPTSQIPCSKLSLFIYTRNCLTESMILFCLV